MSILIKTLPAVCLYFAPLRLCGSHLFSDWLPIQSQFSSSGFPVQKHHHEGHEDHEEKQFKHKERKVENQKKSKAFVTFALSSW
jgi:hypothetical protein